ncbi:MAG: response regulator [Terriglobia bacterium]
MPASEQSSRSVQRLRVLLVEDESLIGLLLEDMLVDLGHFVVGPVAHLEKAVEMARREAIDVAVLDININGEESYPIADALAARDIPFVFSSGYGKAGLPAPYRGHPTLQKPFHQDDLEKLLAKMLP